MKVVLFNYNNYICRKNDRIMGFIMIERDLEKTEKKRNPNIELLRFVLMVAICVWHTFVHGYDYKNMSDLLIPEVNHLYFMGVCVPAVDTFMLISGFFCINYSIKKLFRFIIQALLISNLVCFVKFFLFGAPLSFYDQLLPISSGISWWFFKVYIVIFLLSPIINNGIKQIDTKTFGRILVYLFFIHCVVQFKLGMGGANFTIMLLIYLLGCYLNKVNFRLSRLQSFLMWFVSFLLFIIIMLYFYRKNDYSSIWHMMEYNNLLVVSMAISIFYFVLSFEEGFLSNLCLFLGRHSFSIYLFSEMIGVGLYTYWGNILEKFNAFIFVISVMIFSLLVEGVDIYLQKLLSYIQLLTIKICNYFFDLSSSNMNSN